MLTWKDVCEDRNLANLPYKIELSGSGKIIMSPHRSKHSLLQSRIEALMRRLLKGGEPMPECPVDTADNTKQVDVAWASHEKIARYEESVSWPEAPEVCVEVVSPSNSFAELERKIALYFERGAVECWICKASGEMTFYSAEGKLPQSKFCPAFPLKVERPNDP